MPIQQITTGIIASGAITKSILPTGSVLQVVSTTKTDGFSMTGGTFIDITGLAVTITPSSTSSKVMVIVTSYQSNSGTSGLTTYNLVRGSTNICQPSTNPSFAGSAICYINGGDQIFPFSISHLDSPSTTSATTYKVQMKSNTGTVYINRRDTTDSAVTSTITVMEIAG
jgi:hypothetical protein